MKKPKMIIFDYGCTLLCETCLDFFKGEKAIFEHIVENPDNVTVEQAYQLDMSIFKRFRICRECGFEVHELQMMRFIYEYLKIKFDSPYNEIEKIFYENSSKVLCMPYVNEMLGFLDTCGIRSGVISNIPWSGDVLEDRIKHYLPENKFEFIIASSEYGLRKPDRLIFELALKKAELHPDEVWYCGDNVKADVYGAQSAGIFPVWYNDLTAENSLAESNDGFEIKGNCLHINHWRELTAILDNLN